MFQESIVIPKARQKWPLAFTAGLHLAVIGAILMMPPALREAAEEVIKAQFFQEIAPPPPPPPAPTAPPPPAEKAPTVVPIDTPVQPDVIPEKPPEQVAETPILPGADTGETEPGSGGGTGGSTGPLGNGSNVVDGGDLEPSILRVGGKVQRPTAISQPQPLYPELARRTRMQGTVILEAVINRDGLVEDIRVLKPLGYGLTESAIEAVRKWRFSPATLDGNPVAVYYTLTVNFRLN
jgi:protein TonB